MPTPEPRPKLTPLAKRRLALWSAMRLKDPDLALVGVKEALASGSTANDNYGTWSPLGWAIRNQNPDIARTLVLAGADLNALENGKSLLGMCLLSTAMEPLVDMFLDRGATPSGPLMGIAAKRGNEKIIHWCLDAGLDPNDAPRLRDPVLVLWPAKKPIPPSLLDQSFRPPVSIRAANKFAELITRRKNLPLLLAFIEQAKPLPETRYKLLRLAIQSRWKVGLDVLLEHGYFDPNYQNTAQPSILLSCAPWLNAGKSPAPGLRVLDQLLERGASLANTREPVLSADLPLAVDAFSLIRAVDPAPRPRVLAFLRDHGLPAMIHAAPPAEPACHTLAHTLIRCRDWTLLAALPSLYPGVCWEQPNAPGLLETWGQATTPERHAKPTDPATLDHSLQIVQSLPGFDLHRRNAAGESGFRAFLRHPGGSGFAVVSSRLLQAGLDPFVPDHQGVSDLDFIRQMKLPERLRADFEAQALQGRVQSAGGLGSTRRL